MWGVLLSVIRKIYQIAFGPVKTIKIICVPAACKRTRREVRLHYIILYLIKKYHPAAAVKDAFSVNFSI